MSEFSSLRRFCGGPRRSILIWNRRMLFSIAVSICCADNRGGPLRRSAAVFSRHRQTIETKAMRRFAAVVRYSPLQSPSREDARDGLAEPRKVLRDDDNDGSRAVSWLGPSDPPHPPNGERPTPNRS
jgi:hypothetical protein